MWGVRKQGRKQKGSRERKQSRGGNKKPNKKLPPHSPQSPFFFIPHSPPIPIPAKAGISRLQRQRRESPAKAGIPPFPHFHPPIPNSPHSPPYPHSRESGNLPTPAPAARIPRQRRAKTKSPPKAAKTGDSRFRGNGEFSLPIPLILLFSFPPFFYYPRLPPSPQFPPHSHSRESGNLPTPAPAARIPRESGHPPNPHFFHSPFPRKRESPDSSAFGANPPPKAGKNKIPAKGGKNKSPASVVRKQKSPAIVLPPPRSPYPLRAEKKYPPRPLIVPPRPRLTKKQHQSAFFCILLRFGRQKMVFYRVMGVPPASEAHLFRHWRNK